MRLRDAQPVERPMFETEMHREESESRDSDADTLPGRCEHEHKKAVGAQAARILHETRSSTGERR